MRDLKDKRWIYLKGFLFLVMGLMASAILIIECPTWKAAGMLTLAVWCFARFYYIISRFMSSNTTSMRNTNSPACGRLSCICAVGEKERPNKQIPIPQPSLKILKPWPK